MFDLICNPQPLFFPTCSKLFIGTDCLFSYFLTNRTYKSVRDTGGVQKTFPLKRNIPMNMSLKNRKLCSYTLYCLGILIYLLRYLYTILFLCKKFS